MKYLISTILSFVLFTCTLVSAGFYFAAGTTMPDALPAKQIISRKTSVTHSNPGSKLYHFRDLQVDEGSTGLLKVLHFAGNPDTSSGTPLTLYCFTQSNYNRLFSSEYLSFIYPSHNFW